MGAAASSTNSFVGRERELSELRAALEDANAGRSRLFLFSGEPGIGKTRLAEEIAHEAATRGMRAVWGRSWEGGGAPAYWPWVQILRSLVFDSKSTRTRSAAVVPEVAKLIPELASEAHGEPPSDPKQAQFRLFDAVTTALKDAARAQPLVLILDDLHEADQSSLEMMKFIARALPESYLLIVGTCRDAEVRRSPMLSELITEIVRNGRQILLGGLLQNEVGHMVVARSNQPPSARFINELHQVTAGNPLFVEGVLRVLMAEGELPSLDQLDFDSFKLPEGVRGSIRKRLALLSGPAQKLLVIAAAVGQEFEQAVLQRVSQRPTDEVRSMLRETVEVGLVAADGDPPRFSHPLIREALHQDVGEDESARMHGRIGEVLEELHAADLDSYSVQLAYHYERSGNLPKAIEYSNCAAIAAAKVYAYQQGLGFSETALRLMENCSAPATERAQQLLQIAAFASAVSFRTAIEYLEKAVALFEEANHLEGSAQAHVQIGRLLTNPSHPDASTRTMNIDRAFIHYAAAQKALRDRPASGAIAGLYCGIAYASCEAARTTEAVAAGRQAVAIAEQVGHERVWQQASGALAFALNASGRVSESFTIVERIRERAQLSADPEILWEATHSAAYHFIYGGDLVRAVQLFRRLVSMPVVPESFRRTYSQLMVFPLAATGRLKEARAISTRYPLPARAESAVAFHEGNWEESLALARGEFDGGSFTGSIWEEAAALSQQGSHLRIVGQLERAEPLLKRSIRLCEAQLALTEFVARINLVLIYSELRLVDKASLEIRRCREIVNAAGNCRSCIGGLDLAEGVLAALRGNTTETESRFVSAIQVYRQYSMPFQEAEAFLYWGSALNAHRDLVRATEKFDKAIEIYRTVGAGQRWIERVEKAAASTKRVSVNTPSAERNQFRREGAYWTVIYNGRLFRLKDSKGVRYLAQLIEKPNRELHVFDLIGAEPSDIGETAAGHTRTTLGDAGVALDSTARLAYSSRLEDLKSELEEAERCNDIGRVARARTEMEAIANHLAGAFGLGGRARKAASNSERARLAVHKRIKAAIEQIRSIDGELGRHLALAISTGNFCCYKLDPAQPVNWTF
jgi:tetratricopeptide (TPR) repeat protein